MIKMMSAALLAVSLLAAPAMAAGTVRDHSATALNANAKMHVRHKMVKHHRVVRPHHKHLRHHSLHGKPGHLHVSKAMMKHVTRKRG